MIAQPPDRPEDTYMGAPEAKMGMPKKKLEMSVLEAIIMGLLNDGDIVAPSKLRHSIHFHRSA